MLAKESIQTSYLLRTKTDTSSKNQLNSSSTLTLFYLGETNIIGYKEISRSQSKNLILHHNREQIRHAKVLFTPHLFHLNKNMSIIWITDMHPIFRCLLFRSSVKLIFRCFIMYMYRKFRSGLPKLSRTFGGPFSALHLLNKFRLFNLIYSLV